MNKETAVSTKGFFIKPFLLFIKRVVKNFHCHYVQFKRKRAYKRQVEANEPQLQPDEFSFELVN